MENQWLLKAPIYEGGVLSERDFNIGYGKSIQEDTQTSRMQLVSDTDESEYVAYLAKLAQMGYRRIFENRIAENRFAQFVCEDYTLYVYFTGRYREVRVIEDRVSTPIDCFGDTISEGEGKDTTVIYQYGMMYDPESIQPGGQFARILRKDGMFYVIRLADSRLILIDGGWESQMTEKSLPEALDFLYEVSGTPKGEKIKVAALILTHPHGEQSLIRQYHDLLDVERFCYNFASFDLTEGANTAYFDYGAIFCEKYPDARFLKPHTGQSFTLGDVKIDVMFTHEDMVKADTGTLHLRDVNNTSTVLKLTVHGKTFLLLGDLGTSVKNPYRPIVEDMRLEARFLGMYSAKHGSYPALECDIVQVPHHAIHYFRQSEFYCAIRARYAMLPMTDVEFGDYQPSFYCHVIEQLFVTGAEHILLAGRKTQWLEIGRDGEITVGSEPLRGADDDYLEYLNRTPAFDIEQISF